MMHRVNGRMLHQVPERNGLFRATTNGELNIARQVFIFEAGQEAADVLFDPSPRSYQRFDRRVILGIQARAPLRAATAIEPAPLGAQDVDQGIPNGSVTPSDGLRELFGRQLRNNANQLLVGPVVIVVKAFEIADAHRCSSNWGEIARALGGSPDRLGSPERRS